MPLTPLAELLADARAGGYAVGYFEAWDSYSLEAVIEAAEAEWAPVVLGFGCLLVDQPWLDAGGIETLGCVGRRLAERTLVPVSLLLNEAHTLDQALRGIAAGFNAVMLCTSEIETIAELVHRPTYAVSPSKAKLGRLPDATPRRDRRSRSGAHRPRRGGGVRRSDEGRLPRRLVRQRAYAGGCRCAG